MTSNYISYDSAIGSVSWDGAVEALRRGHRYPKAEITDSFLGPPSATLLNRAAYIDGLGYGVKAVTVMGDNAARGLPTVQGAMMVYDGQTGSVKAIIDSRLVTEIKTASDSVLGAQLLARPDSKRLLIMGAGVVAASLVRAYSALFPSLEQIEVWSRRYEQAQLLVSQFRDIDKAVVATDHLQDAVAAADIISTATMAREPILMGDWVSPGTHVDLIGAFKPDMREADDALISKGSLYVDSFETTVHHIGELMMPIAAGTINEIDIKADLYDMVAAAEPARRSADEITLFKNGGGAHLDLMIADYIAQLV